MNYKCREVKTSKEKKRKKFNEVMKEETVQNFIKSIFGPACTTTKPNAPKKIEIVKEQNNKVN